VLTVPLEDLDERPVGSLDEIKRSQLDRALRYALDIHLIGNLQASTKLHRNR
jgi:hypothetical protein